MKEYFVSYACMMDGPLDSKTVFTNGVYEMEELTSIDSIRTLESHIESKIAFESPYAKQVDYDVKILHFIPLAP